MGWFLLYLLTCVVNTVLIRIFTDLNVGDAVVWLWMIIPGIAYGCGAEMYKKRG